MKPEITTIQVTKGTLTELVKRKINFEAKIGRHISMNDWLMEISKEQD